MRSKFYFATQYFHVPIKEDKTAIGYQNYTVRSSITQRFVLCLNCLVFQQKHQEKEGEKHLNSSNIFFNFGDIHEGPETTFKAT